MQYQSTTASKLTEQSKKSVLQVAFISSHRSRWQVLVVIDSACVSWAAQKKQPYVSTERCWHPSQTPGSLFAHLSVSSPGLGLVILSCVTAARSRPPGPTSAGGASTWTRRRDPATGFSGHWDTQTCQRCFTRPRLFISHSHLVTEPSFRWKTAR